MADASPIILPTLPRPPEDYDRQYMSQLVARLEALQRHIEEPTLLRGTGLVLVAVPTSATGLRSGEVYSDSGTLKVVP